MILMTSVSKIVNRFPDSTTIKPGGSTLKSAYATGAKLMLRCRFPIDIRVYRETRVLPFGKTSLLLETPAIHGGAKKKVSTGKEQKLID